MAHNPFKKNDGFPDDLDESELDKYDLDGEVARLAGKQREEQGLPPAISLDSAGSREQWAGQGDSGPPAMQSGGGDPMQQLANEVRELKQLVQRIVDRMESG